MLSSLKTYEGSSIGSCLLILRSCVCVVSFCRTQVFFFHVNEVLCILLTLVFLIQLLGGPAGGSVSRRPPVGLHQGTHPGRPRLQYDLR